MERVDVPTLDIQNHYLPDFEKWPAPSSHLNNSKLSSVFIFLSFATNLAGSEYKTRESVVQYTKSLGSAIRQYSTLIRHVNIRRTSMSS